MSYTKEMETKSTENPADTSLAKGYVFNFLLILIFIFPNWNLASFQLGPVITNLREVSLVLLPAVYFLYPNRNKATLQLATKYFILVFFIFLLGTELIKKIYYGISIVDTLKNFRVALPVFSVLLVCLQGQKLDAEFTLKTISITLIISFLITPVLVLLGIEPTQFSMDNREFQVEFIDQGRILNNNYQFGLIGIAFLFLLPKAQTYKKVLKFLLIITSLLSVVIMVLWFNRTLLAAAFLLGMILFLKNLTPKTIAYITVALILVAAIGGYFYQNNESIQRQIDRRILVVFEEQDGLAESVYYDNRDKLYAEYVRLANDYWLLGLPGGEIMTEVNGRITSKADISLLNIWFRHGLISLILFVTILIAICLDHKKKLEFMSEYSLNYQITKAILWTVPFFALVSLNVDVLVGHNAVLFLLLFITFYDVEDE